MFEKFLPIENFETIIVNGNAIGRKKCRIEENTIIEISIVVSKNFKMSEITVAGALIRNISIIILIVI